MQIKTLAQILDENPTDPKKDTTTKRSSNKKRFNSHIDNCKHVNNQDDEPLNHKPRQQTMKPARGFAVPDDCTAVPLQDTSDHSDYDTHRKTYHKIKKKSQKKKTFHPAASYKPKLDHSASGSHSAFKEVTPNTVKSILTQLKAEGENNHTHFAESGNNFDANNVDRNSIDRNNLDASCSHLGDNESNNKNLDPLALDDNDLDVNQSNIDELNQTSTLDNLPTALKAYLKTPEQRQAEKEDIKANSRLRWLAFYYLSRREHSQGELRQKLLDKEQDPDKIEALLQEFSEKGYQSDYRTALMLIREGIRKHRGRLRIKNDFYKRKVTLPVNIDELIDMAMADNEAFVDVMSDNDLVEGVDWLQLAVEARVKKYGKTIPIEPKEKARQLRFLQYRGFKSDICFEAITLNLDNIDDRF